MREIKFRGKHIHSLEPNKKLDGIWVYGYLCSENYILSDELCGDMLVDKNTIGQFTGLKDKNGVEIYEGDIIRTYAIKGYGKREKQVEVISQVIFYLSDRFTMSGYPTNETPKFSTRQLNKQDWREVPWSMFYQCEVIGNIYENKELLGE